MRMSRWKFLVLIGLFLNLAVASGGSILAQPTANFAGSIDAASALPAAASYRFGVADKVRLIVFNEPTLSGEFTVSSAGMLSLPLIGDVPVQGKTSSEVIATVTKLLADGYLRDPKVNIDILTYRPFFILGEVGKPGEYPYSNGLTVMNAVATAQGFTYRAQKSKVFLKRAGESAEKAYKLTPDLTVQPGDTIRIGERYF